MKITVKTFDLRQSLTWFIDMYKGERSTVFNWPELGEGPANRFHVMGSHRIVTVSVEKEGDDEIVVRFKLV